MALDSTDSMKMYNVERLTKKLSPFLRKSKLNRSSKTSISVGTDYDEDASLIARFILGYVPELEKEIPETPPPLFSGAPMTAFEEEIGDIYTVLVEKKLAEGKYVDYARNLQHLINEKQRIIKGNKIFDGNGELVAELPIAENLDLSKLQATKADAPALTSAKSKVLPSQKTGKPKKQKEGRGLVTSDRPLEISKANDFEALVEKYKNKKPLSRWSRWVLSYKDKNVDMTAKLTGDALPGLNEGVLFNAEEKYAALMVSEGKKDIAEVMQSFGIAKVENDQVQTEIQIPMPSVLSAESVAITTDAGLKPKAVDPRASIRTAFEASQSKKTSGAQEWDLYVTRQRAKEKHTRFPTAP